MLSELEPLGDLECYECSTRIEAMPKYVSWLPIVRIQTPHISSFLRPIWLVLLCR